MKLKHNIPEGFFKEEPKILVITESKKKLWAVLLDLLIEFDRVCKKNNIKYFVDAGTLLGAVRHKGFIPWDDDIDVVMMRDEYERLCKIAPMVFGAPYFFQTYKTDPTYASGHAQLRNSETTCILKSHMLNGKPLFRFNQGVFIDVFPIDDVPDDPELLSMFRKKVLKCKGRIWRTKYAIGLSRVLPKLGITGLRTRIRAVWLKIKETFLRRDELEVAASTLDVEAQKYNGKGQKRCRIVTFNPVCRDSQLYNKSLYDETAYYEFEGFKFPGPADYETVLGGAYGNWREHVIGGSAHGEMFIDVDNSYRKYL